MIDLNDKEAIKKLDPKDVYGSTGMFANQCQQIIEDHYDTNLYDAHEDYKSAKNIVIVGMGGSAYGAHVALSLYHQDLKIPVVSLSDYTLPGFVTKDTIVLLCSYSGSTEEILSVGKEAQQKGAKITGFSSGGKLGEFLKDYPSFIFDPKFNPSGQPRLGTGYMVTNTILLLHQLGIISVSKEDFQKAVEEVRDAHETIVQKSQDLAKSLIGYIPFLFASEHLVGNAHIIRNQFNETSKSISVFEDIPELNHHLMEGLQNPKDKKLKVIILASSLYSAIHARRVELTKDVVRKNNIDVLEYVPSGTTKLSQVYEYLAMGGYLTLYLALLYGLDPSLIPWVDYFKQQLAKKQ